jgi:hypothetical protein
MCKRSIDAHGIAIWLYSILTLSVPDEGELTPIKENINLECNQECAEDILVFPLSETNVPHDERLKFTSR